MRSVLIAILLLLFPFGSLSRSDVLKPDGSMWQTWANSGSGSMLIKAAYVQGAIEGLQTGAVVGYFTGRRGEKNSDTMSEVMADADKVRGRFTPQNASVMDVVQQMDRFYADYRNTPVCMIQALQESVQSLNGAASSEQNLETMRRARCDTQSQPLSENKP